MQVMYLVLCMLSIWFYACYVFGFMHAKYLVLCMLSVWFYASYDASSYESYDASSYASLSLFMICIIYASLPLCMT